MDSRRGDILAVFCWTITLVGIIVIWRFIAWLACRFGVH
jgi:hypothetical protein